MWLWNCWWVLPRSVEIIWSKLYLCNSITFRYSSQRNTREHSSEKNHISIPFYGILNFYTLGWIMFFITGFIHDVIDFFFTATSLFSSCFSSLELDIWGKHSLKITDRLKTLETIKSSKLNNIIFWHKRTDISTYYFNVSNKREFWSWSHTNTNTHTKQLKILSLYHKNINLKNHRNLI